MVSVIIKAMFLSKCLLIVERNFSDDKSGSSEAGEPDLMIDLY